MVAAPTVMAEDDDGDERNRLVAACVACGSIYAAVELDDGRIQPIGAHGACRNCGGERFRPAEEELLSSLAEDDANDD